MAASSSQSDARATETSTPRASVSPSSVSDQPTTDDTLGFKPYVNAVAAFLMHPETRPPLALSVEGSWGSGKSSFMLQLEGRIKDAGAKTVWFNAWRHDKEDELWAAFALDFTTKLAATLPPWKRWFLHLKLGYLRFDLRRGWFQLTKFVILSLLFIYVTVEVFLYAASTGSPIRKFFAPPPESSQQSATNKHALAGEGSKPKQTADDLLLLLLKVGGAAGYILLGFAIVRKIADVIGNPLKIQLTNYIQDPKYETRTAFIETFHSDFKRLVRTYAEGKRVFVFVALCRNLEKWPIGGDLNVLAQEVGC